ncbi:MAG: DUF308 domain-containing protein [Lachnospiraceae bacterium]|nr:DUF308 domain-containing protein [Lachnospiraceae bacterium]
MIFQTLNKFKQRTIMNSIVLIVAGILMLICPADYIPSMIGTAGAVMLVIAIIGVFDYLDSKKSLMNYVLLTGWLLLGIAGTVVLLFEINSLYVVSWLFGIFLIISGIANIVNAYVYAKRSGRRGWQTLIVLGCALIVFGIIVFINPWMHSFTRLFKTVGVMVLFSSLVSILRLIWIWPIKE